MLVWRRFFIKFVPQYYLYHSKMFKVEITPFWHCWCSNDFFHRAFHRRKIREWKNSCFLTYIFSYFMNLYLRIRSIYLRNKISFQLSRREKNGTKAQKLHFCPASPQNTPFHIFKLKIAYCSFCLFFLQNIKADKSDFGKKWKAPLCGIFVVGLIRKWCAGSRSEKV